MKKMFTNTTLTALIAASLIGCVPASEDEELDSYVRQEAAKLATERQELDKKELEVALAQAKARDPKVTDVYYSVDGNGERQLNIVRESDDGSSNAETFTYALLGAGAAMWMANSLMNNSNMSSSSYREKATSHYHGRKQDNDERKRSGSAAYVAATNSRISNGVYSKARSGGFTSASGKSVSSSSAAFGSSGARGGSVGG